MRTHTRLSIQMYTRQRKTDASLVCCVSAVCEDKSGRALLGAHTAPPHRRGQALKHTHTGKHAALGGAGSRRLVQAQGLAGKAAALESQDSSGSPAARKPTGWNTQPCQSCQGVSRTVCSRVSNLKPGSWVSMACSTAMQQQSHSSNHDSQGSHTHTTLTYALRWLLKAGQWTQHASPTQHSPVHQRWWGPAGSARCRCQTQQPRPAQHGA